MIDVALVVHGRSVPDVRVALGGTFTWKDGRQTSDTAEYVYEFPKGWMLTFSSRLGSGPESDYEMFYGKSRTLDSRDWVSRPPPTGPAGERKTSSCRSRGRGAQPRRQLARLHAVASDAERADPGRLCARGCLLPRARSGAHGTTGQVRSPRHAGFWRRSMAALRP